MITINDSPLGIVEVKGLYDDEDSNEYHCGTTIDIF